VAESRPRRPLASALGWLLLPLVSSNPTLSLVALIATAAGTFAAMGPFWSMPALYLSAKAAPGGIALISALAALMIVVAVTVVAIGHHNRNRASAVPQLKVAA